MTEQTTVDLHPRPHPGSALKRARAYFLDALEAGEGHPFHGLSVREIRDMEHERRPVPNRAAARRHGIRSGYTRLLHKRLAVAWDMRRIEKIVSDPARIDAHKEKQRVAAERAARRTARRAA